VKTAGIPDKSTTVRFIFRKPRRAPAWGIPARHA
jgi:hypothetical protein